jgi:hypothetical protein
MVDNRARTSENSQTPAGVKTYSTGEPDENSACDTLDPFAHFGLLDPVENVRSPQKMALLHPGKDVRDNGRECSVRDGPHPPRRTRTARSVLCGPTGRTVRSGRSQAHVHVQVPRASTPQGQAAERIRRQTAYSPPGTGNRAYRIPCQCGTFAERPTCSTAVTRRARSHPGEIDQRSSRGRPLIETSGTDLRSRPANETRVTFSGRSARTTPASRVPCSTFAQVKPHMTPH